MMNAIFCALRSTKMQFVTITALSHSHYYVLQVEQHEISRQKRLHIWREININIFQQRLGNDRALKNNVDLVSHVKVRWPLGI